MVAISAAVFVLYAAPLVAAADDDGDRPDRADRQEQPVRQGD